jgi:AAA15 family ATPase/GTPase
LRKRKKKKKVIKERDKNIEKSLKREVEMREKTFKDKKKYDRKRYKKELKDYRNA